MKAMGGKGRAKMSMNWESFGFAETVGQGGQRGWICLNIISFVKILCRRRLLLFGLLRDVKQKVVNLAQICPICLMAHEKREGVREREKSVYRNNCCSCHFWNKLFFLSSPRNSASGEKVTKSQIKSEQRVNTAYGGTQKAHCKSTTCSYPSSLNKNCSHEFLNFTVVLLPFCLPVPFIFLPEKKQPTNK